MSRERDLLKEIYKQLAECEKITSGILIDYSIDLIFYEIENFLAQPEQEPLSEDEIDKAYQDSCGNYYDLAFKDGVRFAEQHYGIIGVENEEV